MFNIFGPIGIILVFVSITCLKDEKITIHVAPCCRVYRVSEEVSVAETAVWSITFLINMFTAL